MHIDIDTNKDTHVLPIHTQGTNPHTHTYIQVCTYT